jgi:NADH-quinone oxidoreductase subunit A
VYSTPLWPLIVYFFLAVIIVTGMIALSWVLGQRHYGAATARPYESGIASTGSARLRYDPQFYLIAMFFVIFDLEAAFIFAWAVALRDLGWPGYVEMVVFIGVLVAGLAYLWRLGALDWGAGKRRGAPPKRVQKREPEVEHALVVDQSE